MQEMPSTRPAKKIRKKKSKKPKPKSGYKSMIESDPTIPTPRDKTETDGDKLKMSLDQYTEKEGGKHSALNTSLDQNKDNYEGRIKKKSKYIAEAQEALLELGRRRDASKEAQPRK